MRYCCGWSSSWRSPRVSRLILKAVATTTEQGLFDAVISTESVDRENDVVVAAAMVKALRAWTKTGKRIPLHWNHSSDPEDIIGHVDPESVEEAAGEVVASGWVDQDTERGSHVWRLAKSGTLGFSFGYLIGDAVKRYDGVREICELDVFEISATAAPMNAGTRVLATKAIEDDVPSEEELRRRYAEIVGRADDVREHFREEMMAMLTETPSENGNGKKSLEPVKVASFEC